MIAVTVLVSLTAARWTPPEWLDATVTWISIVFLPGLGVFNVVKVFAADPAAVVRPAGLRARWLGAAGRVNHPPLIAGVSALFALSFETVRQVALFSLTAMRWQDCCFAAGWLLSPWCRRVL